jgi:hypothetical protein
MRETRLVGLVQMQRARLLCWHSKFSPGYPPFPVLSLLIAIMNRITFLGNIHPPRSKWVLTVPCVMRCCHNLYPKDIGSNFICKQDLGPPLLRSGVGGTSWTNVCQLHWLFSEWRFNEWMATKINPNFHGSNTNRRCWRLPGQLLNNNSLNFHRCSD